MTTQIFQALLDGLLMGGVYALAALGLSLIFGVMKITNFAHGAMMTVGMYAVYVVSTGLGLSPYIALLFSAAFLFVVGYVVQRTLIHKISEGPTHNQLLLTLGVAYILENGLLAIFTPNYKSLEAPGVGFVQMGGLSVNTAKLIAFGVVIAVTAAIYLLLYRTSTGKAIRACSQNREGAQLMGVVIKKTNAFAFGIGALCTGIAGGLLTPILSIYPTIGETFQLKCFVIAILGGMGNLWGALISGLIVGVVESLTGFFAGGSWSDLMVYIAFILILLVKPAGLFGRSNRREN
ncbi:MAG: branched-chain amino acid ABC transporter permease [Christensenellaceae bacterium]|nr:branched-chain amino acid ABC transporter permease [Christensenellaceae bacterium]